MVFPSPWPLCMSIVLMNFILSIFMMTNNKFSLSIFQMTFSFTMLNLIFFVWVKDIIRESTISGFHTLKVKNLLKMGMLLFILSEVMFFLSFFWTFFHFSINPALEIGNMWPPMGISSMNPFHIPLLNTLILVSSGVSITYSHHALMNKNYNFSIIWLFITAGLGLYFSALQFYEYKFSLFSFMDSVYGSIFFMTTGFHGFHVIVGTIFIFVSLCRLVNFHFSDQQNIGFEFSCWYWHFVDLVWLFLYLFIYWWGY